MCLATTAGPFLKDFAAPLAWIVAAIGWAISNHNANTREKRKEFRGEIDSIEKVAKAIVEKLTKYMSISSRDAAAVALELEVKVLFREVDFKLERISKRKFNRTAKLLYASCAQEREKFFDQATSEYFETNNRPTEPDRLAAHLQELNIRALFLVEALHALFLKQFDSL